MEENDYDPDIDEDLYSSRPGSPVNGTVRINAADAATNDGSLVDGHAPVARKDPPVLVKRKLDTQDDEDAIKRQKVAPVSEKPVNPLELSAAIWQRVFGYLAPRDLYSVLKVNRLFNECLTSEPVSADEDLIALQPIDSNDVWRSSRQIHLPALPEPLEDLPEKRMLDLLSGSACEICQSQPRTIHNPATVWMAGPGSDGVCIIWHLQQRLCGKCFEENTAKDVEIIITPDKVLLPGLPFVFRTGLQHYIPPSLMKAHRASIPSSSPVFKVYHRQSLGKLRQVLDGLKTVSQETADSWLKDLRSTGERKSEDALRWVNWAMSLPPGKTPSSLIRGGHQAAVQNSREQSGTPLPLHERPISTFSHPMNHPLPARVQMPDQTNLLTSHFTAPTNPFQPNPHYPNPQSQPVGYYAPHHAAAPYYPHVPGSAHQTPPPNGNNYSSDQQERPKLLPREAKQLQMARKAEIERRAYAEFTPPLEGQVLQHITSYNSALLLARPLSEDEWQHLKANFSAERLSAERKEADRISMMNPGAYVDSITQRVNRRAGPGEAAGGDPDRERQQKPVRRRLVAIATEVIHDRWAGATRLLKVDVPNFAADVIVTSLQRLYERTAEDEFEMGHRVTLETVKHLFDNRIKEITDSHNCKELFLCSECENSDKWYTFDGMLQHFGAKHEPDFGVGNVVVAWHSATWPEDPPFRSHPLMSRKVPPAYIDAAVKRQNATAAAQKTTEDATPEPVVLEHSSLPVTTEPAPESAAAAAPIASFFAALRQPSYQAPETFKRQLTPDFDDEYQPPLEYERPQPLPAAAEPVVRKPVKAVVKPVSEPQHVSDNPFLKEFYAPPKTAGLGPREEVALASKEIYEKTAGLPGLADSIRLQTIIYHAGRRYHARFEKALTIDVFMEALSTRTEMKAIRKWSGLICKGCVTTARDAGLEITPELLKRSEKQYSLTPLLAHYKKAHASNVATGQSSDFCPDMVELPDWGTLRSIPYITGMTDGKLQLIAAILPDEVFPGGTPTAQPPVPYKSEISSLDTGMTATRPFSATEKSEPRRLQRTYSISRLRDDAYDTEMSMPEAGEDEYDPRRPIMSDSSPQAKKRHSDGQQKTQKASIQARAKPKRRHDEYQRETIPDVIRTEYDPDREPTPSPPPLQRQKLASPRTGKRQASRTTWQTYNSSTSALSSNVQTNATSPASPPVRAASPPRYFDQYGRPVQLPFLPTTSAPAPVPQAPQQNLLAQLPAQFNIPEHILQLFQQQQPQMQAAQLPFTPPVHNPQPAGHGQHPRAHFPSAQMSGTSAPRYSIPASSAEAMYNTATAGAGRYAPQGSRPGQQNRYVWESDGE